MAKIIIYKKRKKEKNIEKEFEVDKGELVLLAYDSQIKKGKPISVTLGVFEDFVKKSRETGLVERNYLIINRPYQLKKTVKFGGLEIPIILENPNKKGLNTHFMVDAGGLKELHFGQDKIAEVLKRWKGFELYAEIISKMKKPYLIK